MLISSRPSDADVMPLPSDETTPPVMKMCRVGPLRRACSAGLSALSCLSIVSHPSGRTCAPACKEGIVIGAGVDARRGVRDHRAGDADAGLQRPQLFELLQPFQTTRRQPRVPQQDLAAVGVDPEV